MNEQSGKTSYHQLAGEYVLGTLQGNARRQFEMEMERDHLLKSEVENWENRLNPMLDSIEPIEPPRAVWRKIERSLDRQNRNSLFDVWHSLIFWRSFGVAAVATVLVLTLHVFNQPDRTFDRMLVVTNPQSQPGWVVSSNQETRMLRVTAMEAPPLPEGRYCQLWMEDAQGRLIPVGILPHDGSREMATPSPVLHNTLFKVSVEVEQGRPLRAPSPQVIFEGKMVDL